VHQPSELAGGLKLEYPQNSLLIEVAAISSRTFPEQFQYGFLLSDQTNHVIKQKLSREAQFAMEGLKPGNYKVTARAFTKDLVSSAPLSFEFFVARSNLSPMKSDGSVKISVLRSCRMSASQQRWSLLCHTPSSMRHRSRSLITNSLATRTSKN